MAISRPIPIKQTQIVQRVNTYTYTQYVLSPLNPIKSLLLIVKITIVLLFQPNFPMASFGFQIMSILSGYLCPYYK